MGLTRVAQHVATLLYLLTSCTLHGIFQRRYLCDTKCNCKLLTRGCMLSILFYSRTNSPFFMALMYLVTVTGP